MKNKILVIITMVLVCLLATACNYSTGGTTTYVVVTSNATLTALFDTSKNIPATVTPYYVIVTNTPSPATATAVPTNTTVPTSTTVPTATLVPSATPNLFPPPPSAPNAGQASGRSGTLMKAGFISTTPVIDGSWDDWKDYTTQYPMTAVVFGRNNWTGADDLSASYAAAWDYNYLYVGVKVHDDVYAQHATGADIYKGDSIEILLDKNLNSDYYTQSLNSDDYQLGISGGNSSAGIAPSAYMWFPTAWSGPRSDITIGFSTEPGIYHIEARIPWSDFGINPSNGMHLGFAVSASDNDVTNQNLQQSMVSSAPYRSLVNPTTWGELVLTK
jgi:hypothetical protein